MSILVLYSARIDDARVVLIGEASHGTSEFYRMRAQISRALMKKNNSILSRLRVTGPTLLGSIILFAIANIDPLSGLLSLASQPGCGATTKYGNSLIGSVTTTHQ